MTLFSFKSYINFLSRNKLYTLIDLFGLGVSLMFVILIAVYTKQELSTDSFQKNGDDIYLLTNEQFLASSYRLGDKVKERYPQIRSVCGIVINKSDIPSISSTFQVPLNGQKISINIGFVDSVFFQMFSFPLLEGQSARVLSDKMSCVISESYANRAFPGKNPIGERLPLFEGQIFTVSGVMKDIANSCIPYTDVLVRMDNADNYNPSIISDAFDGATNTILAFQVQPGFDIHRIEPDLKNLFKQIFWAYQTNIFKEVHFMPLKKVHFSSIDATDMLNQNSKKFVIILLSVGLLILIFAVLNYINLTVAQAGFRAKEMATRMLLGSSRKELFLRLILESTCLTLIAFLIGLMLADLFAPMFGNLLQSKLFLSSILTPLGIIFIIVGIVFIGAISGLLPATIISSVKSIDVVRGIFRRQTKMVYSKVFITFQHIITIVMIAAAITMIWQTYYIVHAPLGYKTDNIINIFTGDLGENDVRLLRQELPKIPAVKDLALAQAIPFEGGSNSTFQLHGKNIYMQFLMGDSAYFRIFGLKILKDNHLNSGQGYFFTRSSFPILGISEDAPAFTTDNGRKTRKYLISGVLNDFRLVNITDTIYAKHPIAVQLLPTDSIPPMQIVVSVQGNPYNAYDAVKDCFEKITRQQFQGKFVEQQIRDSYSEELQMSRLMVFFAIIAIIISMLGLLAMSTYFIEQRSQEIAIRKVFGSTSEEMMRRLVKQFLIYVLVAFLIACPIIWYLAHHWLASYSYHIPLSPLIFIAAALFCLLVAFLTVFFQSSQAANANPADKVKN